jgi:hypothetical protein
MIWRTSLMGAWMALTMPPPVAASAEPPPTEPLEAYVVDVSTYPSVLIDVVVPWRFTTTDIDPSMLELAEANVESVSPVDPTSSIVGLVIDDGPTVATNVVYSAQGASVELVRNVGDGTAIALSTPSGMLTAPTTDRGATIARIAGITAGAPDVVSLPRLVLDAAKRLTGVAWPDRNLVVVLGRPIAEGPPLRELADVAAAADIRVHVVADPGVDDGAMARIAEETGGLAAGADAMLAEVDQVTAAIAHRVRVAATVTGPGPHQLVLTLNGTRFVAEVDIPTSPSTPTTAGRQDDTGPTRAGPPAEATVPSTMSAVSRTTTAPDVERATPVLIAAALAVLVGAALMWRWRRTRRNVGEQLQTPAPTTAAVRAEVEPVAKSSSRPATAARSPHRDPAANPALEPETAGAVAESRPDPSEAMADEAQLGRRRAAAERPRRATPRRRPATSASTPPDVEPATEAESGEADEWLVAGRLRLSRETGEVFSGARRVSLTPTEFAVLELLMTRGGHGVTRDAIRAATRREDDHEEAQDLDVILAELRRKTGIRGRGRGVRTERALVYFFGDEG